VKYQNVAAFEKHLQEAFPDHLSPIYMVVTSCDFERKKMFDKIVSFLRRKDASSHVLAYDATVTPIESVLEELNTKSLFGGSNLVVLDRIDKLKENEKLAHYIVHPSHDAFLILGASASKPVSDLYQKGKKEVVVLDLSEEKPWDRRRRLNEWLNEEAKLSGKSFSSETSAYLFEHIGLDMPGLYQELVKLICYVGDRPAIALGDAKAICSSHSIATGWQLSEGVIWGSDSIGADKTSELPFLLMFIGQLRYHLQTGYQIAQLLENQGPSQDIARLFPQLRPQTLEKYLSGARQKKAAYFHKGLKSLFDLELGAKSSGLDTSLLFDRFIAKLRS